MFRPVVLLDTPDEEVRKKSSRRCGRDCILGTRAHHEMRQRLRVAILGRFLEWMKVVYSLIATCERHDVNPEFYLADVLIRIQDHPKDHVAELLPHRWKVTFGSGFTSARVETSADDG